MASKIVNTLKKLGRKLIDLNIKLNKAVYSPKMNEKFFEWARENNYRIEKLEVSSAWEAGFFLIQKSGACVKVILVDQKNNRRGAFLQTGLGFPARMMRTKFVEPDKIFFDEPVVTGENNTIKTV